MKYSAISLSALLIQIYLFMLLLLAAHSQGQKGGKTKGNIRICVKHDDAVNTATKGASLSVTITPQAADGSGEAFIQLPNRQQP